MRVLLVALASFCLLLGADGRPDFSGAWKLNVDKSDFGRAPAPDSMTSRIEQHDSEIKVHSEISGPQGSYTTDYKWITDGRENVNTVRGNEIHANVVWKGSTLASNATTTVKGTTLTIVDLWTLSEDAHTLTVSRTIKGPQGAIEQKYVYEK